MDLPRSLGGVTSLARTLDPALPSNRFAIVAAAAGTVVGLLATLLLTDLGILAAVWRGISYGLGAFLAWAIARELDPDHPRAARYAVFAYLLVALTGPPALGATVALLLAARIVVRTPGRAPTRWDLAVVVVVAAIAATHAAGVVVAIALGYAVVADTRLPDPAAEQDHYLATAAVVAATLVAALATGSFWPGVRGPTWLEVVIVLATTLAATRLRATPVHATADRSDQPLATERLTHARRLLLLTVLLALLWAGATTIGALAPALAAVLGIGAVSALRARAVAGA